LTETQLIFRGLTKSYAKDLTTYSSPLLLPP